MFNPYSNPQRARQHLIARYAYCYSLLSHRVAEFREWFARNERLRARFEREAARLEA